VHGPTFDVFGNWLLSADDGTASAERLAHKTPDEIDELLRTAVIQAVEKPTDSYRESAKLPTIV
jgi:hypothetical protein